MAGTQYKPGKMGKITAPLNDKNELGIDGKAYPIAPARLSGVQGADPKVGDDYEYKIAYQGPDKGAIIFFAVHRPTLEEAIFSENAIPAPLKPIDEGLQHNCNEPPEKASPRTIVGIYVEKSSTQVTVKESDGVNHFYPCDIDLLQYLAKKDIPVQKGGTFSWELVQADNKWIAKKVGPAPEAFTGFRSGKEILKENLEAMKTTTTPPETTVPKVPVTEETMEAFNERMGKIAQEKRAQEKAAAEVRAKEAADGDKRMAENAAYAADLAKQASVPAEPTGIAKIVAETKKLKEETAVSIPKSTSDARITLLKAKVAPNATITEFELLMYLSEKYNLDPLLRQIWLVKFGDAPAQIYAGRDGFLEIAHRSGHFDGMETKVIFDENKKPVSAICTVWRNDMNHPFIADVLFSEYTTGKNLWQTKPSVMIGKVAESVALRKAFQVSGLYSPEEVS